MRRQKTYNETYFDRWYRDPVRRVIAPAERRRRVALAVAAAEVVLERRIGSALDVGCGEGEWGVELRRLRPGLRYVGVDSSEYAVLRFGRRRGLVLGSFAELAALDLGGPFDLVLCIDLLHYLPPREIERGLPALAAAAGGLAVLDFCCREDRVTGDRRGLLLRPRSWYERRIRAAGLAAASQVPCLLTTNQDRGAGQKRAAMATSRPGASGELRRSSPARRRSASSW